MPPLSVFLANYSSKMKWTERLLFHRCIEIIVLEIVRFIEKLGKIEEKDKNHKSDYIIIEIGIYL